MPPDLWQPSYPELTPVAAASIQRDAAIFWKEKKKAL